MDAFAGSGALSLEAVSRGAKEVVAIDKDSPAHKILEQNVKELGVSDRIKIIRANSSGWSQNNQDKKFDLMFLDPPYDQLQLPLLKTFAERHVKSGGILVLSYPGKSTAPEFENFKIIANKNYGDSQLVFCRKV